MRDARGIRATAFLSPPRDRLTVVVLNSGNADASVRLDEGSFPIVLYAGPERRWTAPDQIEYQRRD
jgi:hypothetical protein